MRTGFFALEQLIPGRVPSLGIAVLDKPAARKMHARLTNVSTVANPIKRHIELGSFCFDHLALFIVQGTRIGRDGDGARRPINRKIERHTRA